MIKPHAEDYAIGLALCIPLIGLVVSSLHTGRGAFLFFVPIALWAWWELVKINDKIRKL